MTSLEPSPAANLSIQPSYASRSGAPPSDAPPQSRPGIAYATTTGTWPCAAPPEVTALTRAVMVDGVKSANQTAAGRSAIRDSMTERRESPGWSATQSRTWDSGWR